MTNSIIYYLSAFGFIGTQGIILYNGFFNPDKMTAPVMWCACVMLLVFFIQMLLTGDFFKRSKVKESEIEQAIVLDSRRKLKDFLKGIDLKR